MGREWGEDGNGEISLRATWDQGGRDPITARRVPSKYREMRGRQKGVGKGKSRKQGDCAIIRCSFICMYIMIACNFPNDCQPVYSTRQKNCADFLAIFYMTCKHFLKLFFHTFLLLYILLIQKIISTFFIFSIHVIYMLKKVIILLS